MENKYFKAAAALLIGIIFAACGSIASRVIISTENKNEFIYNFEWEFKDSEYIRNQLSEPIWAVADSYLNTQDYINNNGYIIEKNTEKNKSFFAEENNNEANDITEETEGEPTEVTDSEVTTERAEKVEEDKSTSKAKEEKTITLEEVNNILDTKIKKRLGKIDNNAVAYYIQANGKTYSNSDITDKSEFCEAEHYVTFNYSEYEEESQSSCSRNFSFPWAYSAEEWEDNITIYVMVKPEFAQEKEAVWLSEKSDVEEGMTEIAVLIFIALLLLVYLILVCGKKKGSNEIKLIKADYMFSELQPVILIVSFTCAVLIICAAIEGNEYGNFPGRFAVAAVAASAGLFGYIFEGMILSWARNIKNKTLIKHSLTYKLFMFLKKYIVKLKNYIKNANTLSKLVHSEKNGIVFTAGLICYTLIACLFAHMSAILVIVLLAVSWYFMSKKFVIFNELREAISQIRNGNLEYKIKNKDNGILGTMCDDVNMIGEGIKKSVEHEVKAERMKTELITNVSHDLKTPLTSIINYAELLSKENLSPAEANDYVKIIMQKSQRLKNLTQDLFDISKVRSGNEDFNIEKIDASMLLKQVLGENDREIKKTSLDFKVSIEDEAYVTADGKKLARVFENLISNILKYSMDNTRVYISLKKSDKTHIEFKNIASYQMDFDEEEITERFVRGDKSRSCEGSGLGLAIAKSYTEAFGGTLTVKTDGDLFKVIIEL